jgi:DNA-binding NarL/FixJ family response regulator
METLTPRELGVLRLICEGYSTNAVAAQLGVAFKTVACHRLRILDKVGVNNAVQLLRWANKQGVVTVELPQSQADATIPTSTPNSLRRDG